MPTSSRTMNKMFGWCVAGFAPTLADHESVAAVRNRAAISIDNRRRRQSRTLDWKLKQLVILPASYIYHAADSQLDGLHVLATAYLRKTFLIGFRKKACGAAASAASERQTIVNGTELF